MVGPFELTRHLLVEVAEEEGVVSAVEGALHAVVVTGVAEEDMVGHHTDSGSLS